MENEVKGGIYAISKMQAASFLMYACCNWSRNDGDVDSFSAFSIKY